MVKATSSTLVKGYQLSVTTWENDGDAYATKVFDGIPESHIRYITFIIRMFGRQPPHLGGHHISEIQSKLDTIIDYHNNFIDKFGDVVFEQPYLPDDPLILTKIDKNDREAVDKFWLIFIEYFVDDYVGRNFDEGAWDFYRNVDIYSLVYVPETITLPDHTLQINEELESITENSSDE